MGAMRRHRFLLAGALVVVALVVAALAAAALADAPDPKIPPQSPSASVVSITHNGNGTTTVTVKGGWVWTTHKTDCNTDRSGVGFAVDWNDPSDPGFHVTTLNGTSIDVGSTLAVNGNTVDNVVHPTPGTGAGVGKEVDVSAPSQYTSWRGGCGTYTYVNGSGKHPEGIWGPIGKKPGISHTYLDATLKNGISICAIMYDVHPGKTPSQNGGVGIPKAASEVTAGGAGHNDDNGAEKNAGTPLGNACVPIHIPTLTTAPSAIPNDTATVTGGNNPTGTVTFDLFDPGDSTCSGTPAFTQTVALSGGTASTSNTTFVATTPGTWRWRLSYSGDAHNPAKTSGCGIESFTITSG